MSTGGVRGEQRADQLDAREKGVFVGNDISLYFSTSIIGLRIKRVIIFLSFCSQ